MRFAAKRNLSSPTPELIFAGFAYRKKNKEEGMSDTNFTLELSECDERCPFFESGTCSASCDETAGTINIILKKKGEKYPSFCPLLNGNIVVEATQ
jgi:Fe-S-cluster containining protein